MISKQLGLTEHTGASTQVQGADCHLLLYNSNFKQLLNKKVSQILPSSLVFLNDFFLVKAATNY